MTRRGQQQRRHSGRARPGRIAALVLIAALGALAWSVYRGRASRVAFREFGANILLNFLLIYGAGWGIAGSAVGTVIAQWGMFAAYAVVEREPVTARFRGRDVLTNPPPSSGGILIAFALDLLERLGHPAPFDDPDALQLSPPAVEVVDLEAEVPLRREVARPAASVSDSKAIERSKPRTISSPFDAVAQGRVERSFITL